MNTNNDEASSTIAKLDCWQTVIAMLVLSVPFVVTVILLHGLRDHIVTFHGSDEEIYHYPIILRFIETFPRMELWNYRSATTPFFYVLFATIGKIVSATLPFLRGVNVVISYACALLLFFMFRLPLKIDVWTSLLITLVLILSPYFFGISFLLLTDNLAALFAIAAIFNTLLYKNQGRWNLLAFAALFASCAVLTRQLYLWLFVLVLAASLLRDRSDPARSVSGTFALLTLAAAPLVVLFVSWGSFNPPSSVSFAHLNLRAVGFFTACLGLYATPFLATAWWRERQSWRDVAQIPAILVVLVVTIAMLWTGPLQFSPAGTSCNLGECDFPTDGYLWRLSGLFPIVGGSNLLFWGLVPLGLGTILHAWRQKGINSPALLVYLSFAAFSISNASLYQKYFDFLALLICCLIMFRQEDRILSAKRFILLAYCLGFTIYAIGKY
jgi:hypothetical protein